MLRDWQTVEPWLRFQTEDSLDTVIGVVCVAYWTKSVCADQLSLESQLINRTPAPLRWKCLHVSGTAESQNRRTEDVSGQAVSHADSRTWQCVKSHGTGFEGLKEPMESGWGLASCGKVGVPGERPGEISLICSRDPRYWRWQGHGMSIKDNSRCGKGVEQEILSAYPEMSPTASEVVSIP